MFVHILRTYYYAYCVRYWYAEFEFAIYSKSVGKRGVKRKSFHRGGARGVNGAAAACESVLRVMRVLGVRGESRQITGVCANGEDERESAGSRGWRPCRDWRRRRPPRACVYACVKGPECVYCVRERG